MSSDCSRKAGILGGTHASRGITNVLNGERRADRDSNPGSSANRCATVLAKDRIVMSFPPFLSDVDTAQVSRGVSPCHSPESGPVSIITMLAVLFRISIIKLWAVH